MTKLFKVLQSKTFTNKSIYHFNIQRNLIKLQFQRNLRTGPARSTSMNIPNFYEPARLSTLPAMPAKSACLPIRPANSNKQKNKTHIN